jgi:hypothetical protein
MSLCSLNIFHAHMGFIKMFNRIYHAQNTFHKIVSVLKHHVIKKLRQSESKAFCNVNLHTKRK